MCVFVTVKAVLNILQSCLAKQLGPLCQDITKAFCLQSYIASRAVQSLEVADADWLVSLSTITGCCQPFIARCVHLRTTEEETATTENKKTEAFIIQLKQLGTHMTTAARTETKQAMCFCGKLLKNWVTIVCCFCIKNQSDRKLSLPRGQSCVKNT